LEPSPGGSSGAATSTATVSGCVEMIQAAVRKVLGKEANLGHLDLKPWLNMLEIRCCSVVTGTWLSNGIMMVNDG